MKTKIIYISGGEVFPPQQVRAAFDAVRGMLCLDSDTVIFGVPVDCDDIGLSSIPDAHSHVVTDEKGLEKSAIDKESIVPAMEIPEASLIENQIATKPVAEQTVTAPPIRKRKKKETEEQALATPILSVLGSIQSAKEESVASIPDPTPVANPEPVKDKEVSGSALPGRVSDDFAVRSAPSDNYAQTPAVKTSHDDVKEEMLVEAVEEDVVQSIEDIFAGIPPLSEDKPIDLTTRDEAAGEDEYTDSPVVQHTGDDATLSKLAAEFIAVQDKDLGVAKELDTAKGGKIGRLKNILPFKKKERAEPSVLGDLFGWAGVAANDDTDSFAMPDFFQMGGNR
ncbi:MAG: hypothetical protein FWG80_01010 [Alphaproteobacteria bacterium]|nr:hypothetical protein [Alphaproteobacteria bacterium]